MTREAPVPVEVGQSRKSVMNVWGVLRAHPRRRGFFVCVASDFPYDARTIGRRELEEMPVAAPDYFGGGEHPGLGYWQSFEQARWSAQ